MAINGSYKSDKVTISNWALDVTNKKTFPIHMFDGLSTDYTDIWRTQNLNNNSRSTTQRFVDNNPDTKAKRVYWGIDPNYKNNNLCRLARLARTRRKKSSTMLAKYRCNSRSSDPLYCLENTFNLDNMSAGTDHSRYFQG